MAERTTRVRLRVEADTAGVDQYNRKMKDAEKATKEVGQSSKSLSSGIDTLNNSFNTLLGAGILGFGLSSVKGFAEEMYNAGSVSNQTAKIFEQMISPMTSVEDMMNRLREATLGIASDTDIQTGANLLLRMGIAENPEELEDIIGLVTRLKSPTEDLGSAINNFGLMMANQSVMRLDSFGLSSGRVRDRIEELIASGQALNREEAFKLAVLEEGARAVDRLGDAAGAAATPLARLQVTLENVGSQLSGQFAQGVEGTAGIIEVALGIHPKQAAARQRALDDFNKYMDTVGGTFQTASLLDFLENEPSDKQLRYSFVADYIEQSMRVAAENPQLLQDAAAFRERVIRALDIENINDATWGGGNIWEVLLTPEVSTQLNLLDDYAEQVRSIAGAEERLAEVIEGVTRLREEGLRIGEQVLSNMIQQGAAAEMGGLSERLDQMRETADIMGALEMPEFMDADRAQGFRVLADTAATMVEEMQRLDEFDGDLFSADELQRAQATARELDTIARDAEAAAAAFEKIKLSDIFGQGGNALQMDINRIVMAALPAGTSDEQRAAIERELSLASGEETQASLYFKEQVIPGILSQADDPEVIAAMTTALGDIFRAATLEGVDTEDLGFLEAIQSALSPENLEAFDAESFVSAFQDSQTAAEGIEGGLAAAARSTETSAIKSAELATNLALGNTKAAGIAENLSRAFDRNYQLSVTIDAIAPQWLKNVLNDPTGATFANMMERSTKDNGGTPPGARPDRPNR